MTRNGYNTLVIIALCGSFDENDSVCKTCATKKKKQLHMYVTA